MLPSVYIETSVVSYLVARPSRDPIMAERQRQTRDWWENRRGEYELFTSKLTTTEALVGEESMARLRVEALGGFPRVPVTRAVFDLAKALVARGPLPAKARSDAWHISLATVAGLDFLLTWNCRHIANPRMYATIHRVCRERGFAPPVLCTPDDLLRR
jgi:hypothetical protein